MAIRLNGKPIGNSTKKQQKQLKEGVVRSQASPSKPEQTSPQTENRVVETLRARLNRQEEQNRALKQTLETRDRELAGAQAETARFRQENESYRRSLWKVLQAGRTLANANLEEQRHYRKILGDSWLNLQLLLGSARAGRTSSVYRDKLQNTLAQGIAQASQIPDAPRSCSAQPPLSWRQKEAGQDAESIGADLIEARTPVYPAKELALQLYLTLLEEQEDLADALTGTLRACGVEVLYYDGEDTPPEVRQNERNYTQRPSGNPYPALLAKRNGEWILLAMGAWVKDAE